MRSLAMFCAVLICGCTHTPVPAPPRDAPDPDPQAVDRASFAAPQCWGTVPVPAIYAPVMGEIQVVQAEIAPDGRIINPPIYRRAEVPQLVRPRGEMQFEAVCPTDLTPDLIASVQRALAARALYDGPAHGTLDQPTRAAIRQFQTERGLNSDRLSIETARALGLIAVERPRG